MKSAIAMQMVLATLRHAMTALAPLGIVVSDDWIVQTAGVIVGLGGYLWSLKRKVKSVTA